MWYARPVFFVADVNRAARFYIDMLGFEKRWHEGDGAGTVCQVNRADCEIILCEDAGRRDQARLFIELNAAELAALRRELALRSVPSKVTWWGYDTLQIDDPDLGLLSKGSGKGGQQVAVARAAVGRLAQRQPIGAEAVHRKPLMGGCL